MVENLTVEVDDVLQQVARQRNDAQNELAKVHAAVVLLQKQLEAKDEEIARLNRLVAKHDHVGDSGL